MPRTPGKKESEVAAPDRSVEIPDPRSSTYEPSHVIQLLVAVQRELAANTTKIDRAISDLAGIDKKVGDLGSSFTWVKGFGAAALILIPLCAAIIWWFVGDQIGQMKGQLLQLRAAPSITAPPSSVVPPAK